MNRRIGRYEVVAELGRGGFGRVYRGLDPTVGRPVAIKVLAAEGDEGMLTRFRGEAIASGRLRHPNIITVYDFGEQDGVPFIVMELLEGQDLQRVIESRTAVSLLNKTQIMVQIAAGLRHAHAAGIIHRDVKPANVMLLVDGSVKIMDFGIALLTQATHSRLTPRGAMIGTFRYMAPEQFRNAKPDARSDIFAYGLIFYELLSGIHPFHAADAGALMYNILSVEPVPVQELVPDCPIELAGVIRRLLAKDPDSRYQSLDDVLFDIEPALEELRRKRSQELLEEARIAKQAQRFEPAQELVKQILELTPGDIGARQLREEIQVELRRQAVRPRVEDLIRKGREAMAAGLPAEAVERFESAIRLGGVSEIQPLLEEARAGLERSKEASRLAADAENAHRGGDLAGAVQLARRALELAPGERRAERVLAEAEGALAEERRRARLTEDLVRAGRLIDIRSWEEASKLLAKAEREFPGIAEIGVLAEKLRTGWAKDERERLLAAGCSDARQQVQQGDMMGALATLEKLATEYPDSTDVEIMLGFVRLEIETKNRHDAVWRSVEGAKAATDRHEFEAAFQVLDAALARYPDDPDLQRQRRNTVAEQRKAKKRAAAEEAIALATPFRSQGRFPEALAPLDSFSETYGPDPAIAELRDAILNEQEAARRAADLHNFIHKARDLMDRGHADEATALLRVPPAPLRDHPEVTQLLGAAQLQLQQQAERNAALEQTLAATIELREQGRFLEATRLLDGFQTRYGADAQIEHARGQVIAERNTATRALLERASTVLASDPAAATALFQAAPEDLRLQPEIQNLERAAALAVEERKAREAAAKKAIASAGALRSQERFAEALQAVDSFLAAHGPHPAVAELRLTVLKEQEAAWRAAELRDFLRQARDLMARDQADDAVALIEGVPQPVRSHPDLAQLLGDAQRQVRERAEREKAVRDLEEQGTAMLAGDPAGAVALVGSAPDYLRQRPEIQKLERAARQAVAEREARAAAVKTAIASASTLGTQGRFPEALTLIDDFVAAHGADPSVAELRQAILKDQEGARLEAELREFAGRAQALITGGRPDEAVALLQTAPSQFRDHPELLQLLATAQGQVRQQAKRKAAFDKALAAAARLTQQGSFEEALQSLDALEQKHGADPLIEQARSQVKQAERDKAARELLERATTMMTRDPAAVTALFEATPEDLRRRPEVQNLEQAAARAVEEQKTREAEARLVQEVRELCANRKFDAAIRMLDEAATRFPGKLKAIREEVVSAHEVHARERSRKETIDKAQAFAADDRYEDAIQALASLIAKGPKDEELLRLRADIETRQAAWTAERNERNVRERLSNAKGALSRAPGEAVQLLEALDRDHPGREDVAGALRTARESYARKQWRDLIEDVDRLCKREEFGTALARLNAAPPIEGDDLLQARERVKTLQRQSLDRRAAEAIQTAFNLRERDPRAALQGLEELPEALAKRDDVRAAMKECQTAIVAAERIRAIGTIEDLCSRGKFREAGTRYQQAVALLGADAELEELSTRIEAGLQTGKGKRWPLGVAAAVVVAGAIGIWMYIHKPPPPPPPVVLVPVEIRTEPAGASVVIGSRTCKTPNCKFDLPPGSYQLRAQLDGYGTKEQTLTVGTEKSFYSVNLLLDPIVRPPAAGQKTGTLVVQAKTPDATVYIDNKPQGHTDSEGKFSSTIEVASHTVRVEKNGYQTPLEKKVRIEANKQQTIAFELIPQNARLELRGAPADVTARAGDTILGRTDGSAVFAFPKSVTPGDQALQFSLGAASSHVAQRFEPGQTVTLDWAKVAPLPVPTAPPPTPTPVVLTRVTPTPTPPVVTQPKLDPAEQAWGQVDKNNLASLQDYVNRFRGSAHEAEARSKIADLVWSRVDPKDEQALRAFIQQYPDSPHRPKAQTALDEITKLKTATAEETARQQRIQQEEAKKQIEGQVNGAVGRFNEAFASTKLGQQRQRDLKAVWPEVPKSYLEALNASHLKMELKPELQTISVAGDSVSVMCGLTTTGPQANRTQRVKVIFQKQQGGELIIQSVKANGQ